MEIDQGRVTLKGMNRHWHVYDRARGSFPQEVPGYGVVQPDEGFKDEQEAWDAVTRYAQFIAENPKSFP